MAKGTPEIPHTYPQGVPSWVDVEQPDPSAAREFYGALLGWTFEEAGPGYWIAALDGLDCAGLAAGDAPARWSTYIAVDELEAVVEAIERAGGEVLLPAQQAGDAGRMAVARDPEGAEFRLWQAQKRPGSQINNLAGSWNFSDLHTPDRASAFPFYRSVFGWEEDDMGPGADFIVRVPGYGDHLQATVDPDIRVRQAGAPSGFADAVAGFAETDAGEAPHWHVTFSVLDRDAAIESVEHVGGTVVRSWDEPWGLKALVRDPQGAEFTLSQFRAPG